jgi:nitrite reductase/ring-hydroxylating ferredoxin subunit
MAQFVKVASTSEVTPGQCRVVEAEGKTLALSNVDGTFYAIDNTCIHQGGPLGEGSLQGNTVTCPWHAWEYDVTTGKNTMNPSMGVGSYPVKVDGDNVLVEV